MFVLFDISIFRRAVLSVFFTRVRRGSGDFFVQFFQQGLQTNHDLKVPRFRSVPSTPGP